AFLIALVSASRPSDLVRIDLSTIRVSRSSLSFQCIDPKEFKIALAHSSSTMKKNSKSIFVGSFPENDRLCPYSALTTLLQRTQDWQVSSLQKRSLFLITRQPYNP